MTCGSRAKNFVRGDYAIPTCKPISSTPIFKVNSEMHPKNVENNIYFVFSLFAFVALIMLWSEKFTGYFPYKKRVNVADSRGIPVLTSCLCSLL